MVVFYFVMKLHYILNNITRFDKISFIKMISLLKKDVWRYFMKEKVKIVLSFVNKRGENKNVKFYIDKCFFDLISNDSLDEKYKQEILIDEYHRIERERKQNKKILKNNLSCNDIIDNSFVSIDDQIFKQEIKNKILSYLNGLSYKQRKVIYMIFYEGKRKVDVARELNISKSAVSITYKRAIKNLKKIVKL